MKKYIYLCLFVCVALGVYGQVNLGSTILNGQPGFSQIQTYSRYDAPNDNLAQKNFYICNGESDRMVHMRIVAQDNNSHTEITNGGNVSFKVAYLVDGSQVTLPSFGSLFKEPIYESTIGTTQLSYIDNITLTNTSSYSLIANVSDKYNSSKQDNYTFTINNTNCIRVEESVNLVANETFTLNSNFTQVSIVVNESVSGNIIITEHTQSPVDSGSDTALDKYVTVDITGPVKNLTVNLTIVVNYTDADLSGKDLDESTLQLYFWNNLSEWESRQSTIDTSENTVTFFVEGTKSGIADTRLGTFSIRGTQESTPSGGSGGGSGGGGGGGGGSSSSNSNAQEETAVASPVVETPNSNQQTEPVNEISGAIVESSDTQAETQSVSQGEANTDTQDQRFQESRSNSLRERISGSILGVFKDRPVALSFFAGSTDERYCLIIILILLFLWLTTLFLLFLERRKRKENELCEMEIEKSKLLAQKEDIEEKIVALSEKQKNKVKKVSQQIKKHKKGAKRKKNHPS